MLATALLTDQPCSYSNVPLLSDVRTQVKILEELGIACDWRGRRLTTDVRSTDAITAPYELVRQMRASVLVLGPLLARRGEARVSLPGGCVIGERPVDLHLHGLRALGAEISMEHGYVHAKAPAGGLVGSRDLSWAVNLVRVSRLLTMSCALRPWLVVRRLLNALLVSLKLSTWHNA